MAGNLHASGAGKVTGRRAVGDRREQHEGIYGNDLTDGAVVRFNDGKPSNSLVAGRTGVVREFGSGKLRCA
jgi:hypothetical protein